MERVMKITKKLMVLVVALVCVLSIGAKAIAATTYTKNLKKGDKLKFTGTAWYTYKTKALAEKTSPSDSNGALKNGDTFTIQGISGNVLKIGTNKYIYYGATASSNFKKVSTTSNTTSVTGVSLNETKITLNKKGTYQLKATVKPSNASNKKVTWTSSDKKVATVTSTGKVTAKKAGTATITVTTKDGGKTAKCTVTVKEGTTLAFKNSREVVEMGQSLNMSSLLTVKNGNKKDVKWASSNAKAATIDGEGNITTVGAHSTTITATLNGVTAKCKLTVTSKAEKIKVSKIVLDKKSVKEMNVGDEIKLTATVTVTPDKSGNREVKYTSSNPSAVTVEERTGKVKAIKATNKAVTITATSIVDGSKKATFKIGKVVLPVSEIQLKKTEIEVVEGKKGAVEISKILPTGATNKAVEYTTSDSKIINVNKKTGTVKGLKCGEAKVTVTAKDGSKVKAVCKVKVVPAVKTVTLDSKQLELRKGDKYTLTATVVTADNSKVKVTWASDNKSVATVSNSGKVTAKKEGTATITAKAGTITASCKVNVTESLVVAKYSFTGRGKEFYGLSDSEIRLFEAVIRGEGGTNLDSVFWTASAMFNRIDAKYYGDYDAMKILTRGWSQVYNEGQHNYKYQYINDDIHSVVMDVINGKRAHKYIDFACGSVARKWVANHPNENPAPVWFKGNMYCDWRSSIGNL